MSLGRIYTLTGKRAALDRIAKILQEKEVIEGDELRRLLKEEDGEVGKPKEEQTGIMPEVLKK